VQCVANSRTYMTKLKKMTKHKGKQQPKTPSKVCLCGKLGREVQF
jgi:hypothetical protein